VDDNFNILQFRGRTGDFLEPAPGQASLNVLKMAREGLIGELRNALSEAKKDKRTIQKENLRIVSDRESTKFNLEVSPYSLATSDQFYYIVSFEKTHASSPVRPKKAKTPSKRIRKQDQEEEIVRLRAELSSTKEYLQSNIEEQEVTNEELRAANEEILSSNEELQSTNEEMETAKEELQSANEELTTVNEELQVRNTELSHSIDDLNNFLASVHIPILMVGRDLRLRRFTAEAEKKLNLLASDVGRPITDINLKIEMTDLAAWITEVIDEMHIKEIEVRDKSDHWYMMQIRPYKSADNKIEGAVLVLLDIDALKRNVEARRSEEYLRVILETLHIPLVMLDGSLRITMANPAFREAFDIGMQQIEGRHFYEVADGRLNLPKLKSSLEGMIRDGTHSSSLTVDLKEKDGRKKLIFNARRIKLYDGRLMIFLAMTGGAEASLR
jgi:two-component system CheB/CheR fusion protein